MQIVCSRFSKATGISLLIHLVLGLAISFVPMAPHLPQAAEVAPTLVEIVPSRVLSMGDMTIAADTAPTEPAVTQQRVPSQVVQEMPEPRIVQEDADVPALAPLVSGPVNSVESVIESGGGEAEGQGGEHDGQTAGKPVNVLRGTPPKYPAAARKAGWEGTVLVSVQVEANGSASTVTVRESSGYASLDEVVIETVKKWRFSPATKNGIPVTSLHAVRVRFRLTDRS